MNEKQDWIPADIIPELIEDIHSDGYFQSKYYPVKLEDYEGFAIGYYYHRKEGFEGWIAAGFNGSRNITHYFDLPELTQKENKP